MRTALNENRGAGYKRARGVPVLGIEPAAGIAKVAIEKEISSVVRFFGRQSAAGIAPEHGRPAHVPDINDFVGGKIDA